MARKRLNVKFLVVLVSIAGVLLVSLAVAGWWYKESPGRAIRRAQEAEERGDWEKAAEQWAKAARASNDGEYLLKAIDASMKRTSGPEGRELLQQINQNYTALLVSDPGLMPALRGQMRLLAGDRAFGGTRASASTREVRRLAGEILKQEPADSEAKTLRALATINLSQFNTENIPAEDVEQAELELRSVAEVDPCDGLAVANLAQRMLTRADQARADGDIDAALEQWQDAVKFIDDVVAKHGELSDPPTLQEARLHWRFGQSYAMAARVKPIFDAVKLTGGGTAVEDIDTEQLMSEPVTAATVQKGHDHTEKAREALDEERDLLEEDYRDIRMAWADALVNQGKAQEAEQEIRSLLEARPWDTQVSATLARMLLQQNRHDEAVAVVREARKRESESLPELEGHAGVNAQINRMLLKPFEAEVLLTRYEGSRDPEQRKQLLAEARTIYDEYEGQRKAIGYPALSESTRVAGQIQIAESDLAGGIQTLTSALRFTTELRTQNDRRERLKVLGLLVDANRQLGQTGAQRRYLEEMIQLAPGVSRLGRELAEVYLAQGETTRARELINRFLAQSPDDPALQELALRATPEEERQAAYAQLPETTQAQLQAKLSAALRLNDGAEVIRIGNLMREALPAAAEQRTAQEQQLYEGLTLTVAQQLGRLDRKDEAIAMVRPLAEASPTAKALLTQLEGGTEALVESLPEGANKLMVEAQLAELRGESALALSKLEEAAAAAPDNDTIGNRLFSAYLARERLDKAEEVARALRARGADQMGGGTYTVRLALARGDLDAAVRASTDLAQKYPEFAEALALHGESLRQAGRPAEAVGSFRRSLALSPNTPATLVAILTSLEAAGQFQEARPYIDAGLRLQPENATFQDADRIFQIRFGDPSEVIATRRRAVANDPDSDTARWDLGQTLMFAASAATRVGDEVRGKQHLDEAVQVFAEAARKFPADVRFVQGVVRSALQAGPEAMAIAEPVVQASVVAADAPLARDMTAVAVAADFLTQKGDLPRAESVIRTALSEPTLTRDQKVALLQMLSEVLVSQNRLDDAIGVLAGYEDVPAVLQRKVEILARQVSAQPDNTGYYQALRQASDAAIADQTMPAGGIPAIAYAEMQRGDLTRAVSLLDQALERQANNPRALLLRGAVEARREGGNMDRAAQWLEHANRLMPDDQDTLRELGRLQRRRGMTEEAVKAMTRLTELRPADAGARIELLNLLLSLNPPRFAEANRQFRAAEREGLAGDPMLLMARAQMEQLRGRMQDGLPFARQAIQRSEAAEANLSPEQKSELLQAYLNLLTAAEQHEELLQVTQAHVANAATAPWWILRARGEALASLNRREEAIATYKQAFAAAQPAAMDDAVLVDMSRHVGFDDSYALIKDRVEPADGSPPAPRDLLIASSLYAQAGQMDRAVKVLEEALAREADLTPEQKVSLDTQLGTTFLVISPRNLERSIFHLRRAADMQPENVGVLNNLAYALTLQSEEKEGEAATAALSEALEIARRAYDLNVSMSRRLNRDPSPTILDTYGWALALSGLNLKDAAQQQEALRLIREARGLAEDSGSDLPEIYLHQSRLLSAMGNGQAAQEAAETGLARLERRGTSSQPLESHLEADLRAALMRARDMATSVQGPTSSGG